MRAICEFVEYIKVITNHQDIRPPVIVKFYYLMKDWMKDWMSLQNQTYIGKHLLNCLW